MSAIDDQINDFYDRMLSLELAIETYEKWMKSYLEVRKNYPEWVTKKGEHIKIENLKNGHLKNIINLLKEKDKDAPLLPQ